MNINTSTTKKIQKHRGNMMEDRMILSISEHYQADAEPNKQYTKGTNNIRKI